MRLFVVVPSLYSAQFLERRYVDLLMHSFDVPEYLALFISTTNVVSGQTHETDILHEPKQTGGAIVAFVIEVPSIIFMRSYVCFCHFFFLVGSLLAFSSWSARGLKIFSTGTSAARWYSSNFWGATNTDAHAPCTPLTPGVRIMEMRRHRRRTEPKARKQKSSTATKNRT